MIAGVKAHTVRRGESAWQLALDRYDVPIWLLAQYNPSHDLASLQPGATIRIPLLSDAEGS